MRTKDEVGIQGHGHEERGYHGQRRHVEGGHAGGLADTGHPGHEAWAMGKSRTPGLARASVKYAPQRMDLCAEGSRRRRRRDGRPLEVSIAVKKAEAEKKK